MHLQSGSDFFQHQRSMKKIDERKKRKKCQGEQKKLFSWKNTFSFLEISSWYFSSLSTSFLLCQLLWYTFLWSHSCWRYHILFILIKESFDRSLRLFLMWTRWERDVNRHQITKMLDFELKNQWNFQFFCRFVDLD